MTIVVIEKQQHGGGGSGGGGGGGQSHRLESGQKRVLGRIRVDLAQIDTERLVRGECLHGDKARKGT